MERLITNHIVDGDPAPQLTIEVTDEPGPGGAYHRYEVTGFDTIGNQSRQPGEHGDAQHKLVILFQNGPIRENGVNGITGEAMLAILIDRYAAFQDGPYANPQNRATLDACRVALAAQQLRTVERLNRRVEGTSAR